MDEGIFHFLFDMAEQEPLLVCSVIVAIVVTISLLVVATVGKFPPLLVFVVLSITAFGFSQLFPENRDQKISIAIGETIACGVLTWWWFRRIAPYIRSRFVRADRSQKHPTEHQLIDVSAEKSEVANSHALDSEKIWCAVANVVMERPYGPGGIEKRSGTKHFAPGAKVYLIYTFWGPGGKTVKVVGRHRKSHRYICLDMRSAHLTNWRAEAVYSPYIGRQADEHGGLVTKKSAEEIVSGMIALNSIPNQAFITRPPQREK